jgi:dCTP deaminase
MLSDDAIVQEMAAGAVVIEPFDWELLNTNSYDVRIGNWSVRQKTRSHSSRIVFNTAAAAERMWEKPVYSAEEILVLSGETILCHTEEVIGGKDYITTEMRAKSTTARFGLSVCKCAGLGDVGFISRWTMEVTNHSDFDIVIPVGEPIAQILFHRMDGAVARPYGSGRGSRYGQGEWTPEDMLPKGKN